MLDLGIDWVAREILATDFDISKEPAHIFMKVQKRRGASVKGTWCALGEARLRPNNLK